MSSLPASVVLGGDLDSLYRLMSGRLDYPFFPEKESVFVQGFCFKTTEIAGVYSRQYILQQDVDWFGIAVAASRYDTEDNWGVYFGDDIPENYVCRKIYTKDMPEGIQFTAVKRLHKGDMITFVYDNVKGNEKYVWFNYSFLTDPII